MLHRFEGALFLPFIPVGSSRVEGGATVASKVVSELEKSDISNVDYELQQKWQAVCAAVEVLDQDLHVV